MFDGAFWVAVMLLLVVDDGGGCSSAQEVLPSDCLLVDGCLEEWMGAWEFVVDGGVAEPLDETL